MDQSRLARRAAWQRARLKADSNYRRSQAAAVRAWNRAHPEAARAKRARWALAHPEAYRAKKAANAAASRFGERVPASVFRDLMARPCVTCGVTPAGGVDHVIPRSKGGRNIVSNLQPMCFLCNTRKGARL